MNHLDYAAALEPRTETVDITPDLAKQWLHERNHHNRPLGDKLVKRYAAAMAAGDWALTHQGIGFGRDSTPGANDAVLLDGQHRLAAIVASGRTVRMLVTWNLVALAQESMDVGGIRTTGQMLHLRGWTNATTVGAAAALLWRYERDQWISTGRKAEPAKTELLRIADACGEALAVAVSEGKRVAKAIGMADSAAAAGFYLTNAIDPAGARAMIESLAIGANLAPGDPVLILRNKVITHKGRVGTERVASVRNEEWLALYIKAWNFRRTGRPIRHRLTWTYNGEKPEPFPRPV